MDSRKEKESYDEGDMGAWLSLLVPSSSNDHFDGAIFRDIICVTPPLFQDPPIFARELESRINSCDVDNLMEFFGQYCSDGFSVRYIVQNQVHGDSMVMWNPLGNFDSVQFPSVGFYLEFMRNFYQILPDAVIRVDLPDGRPCIYCQEDGSRMYSFGFQWFGTSVVTNTALIRIDPYYSTIALYDKSQDFIDSQSLEMLTARRLVHIRMKGTLNVYFNVEHNKIDSIEFHYQYM